MEEFNATRFRNKVKAVIGELEAILDTTRKPVLPSDVPHEYNDKYLYAEFISCTLIVSIINTLEFLGLDRNQLKTMKSWTNDNRSVTLRFTGEETCIFKSKKEKTRKDTPTVEVSSIWTRITRKTITKYTVYYWKFTTALNLFAFYGNDVDKNIPIYNPTDEKYIIIESLNESAPWPEKTNFGPLDVNITVLFEFLDENLNASVTIHRESKSCRTPRRNEVIEKIILLVQQFYTWSDEITHYYNHHISSIAETEESTSKINDDFIFIPIIPFFETNTTNQKSEEITENTVENITKQGSEKSIHYSVSFEKSKLILPKDDLDIFFQQQRMDFTKKLKNLSHNYSSGKLIGVSECQLVLSLLHISSICKFYYDAIQFIENLLMKQLIQAIGKEITSQDLDDYMNFHYRKLFLPPFRPIPICYSIRRPDHYPEGSFSIHTCQNNDTSDNNNNNSFDISINPILSFTRVLPFSPLQSSPMNFSISAGIHIQFCGDVFIHSLLSHQFSTDSPKKYQIVARARQFSNFILLIGNILNEEEFNVQSAMIIRNKDEFIIPLDCEMIPTAKSFKKSIESLSSNQREFTKAIRSMQLDSSLLGFCVIQIKPLLEKILHLSDDSLTKEIRLMNDLLELFIDYQIPSDLLSFQPDSPNQCYSSTDRILKVKQNVAAVKLMIDNEKKKEIKVSLWRDDSGTSSSTATSSSSSSWGDSSDESSCDNEGTCSSSEGSSSFSDGLIWKNSSNQNSLQLAMNDVMDTNMVIPRGEKLEISSGEKMEISGGETTSIDNSKPETTSDNVTSENIENSMNVENHKEEQLQTENKQTQSIDKLEKRHINDNTKFKITELPALLDKKFEELDSDDALHATILKPTSPWQKKAQSGLLGKMEKLEVDINHQKDEKNKAFDLLDTLSISGSLLLENTPLHVVVSSIHCFDKTLIHTVIQDNSNPIEKLENSALIISSTIHETPVSELLTPGCKKQ